MVAATDGFLRDIGGTHARLPHDERFTRVARLLCEALASLRPSRVAMFLDEPLPWSREHVAEIRELWEGLVDSGVLAFEVRTECSVDAVVAATTEGVIATSDTATSTGAPHRSWTSVGLSFVLH